MKTIREGILEVLRDGKEHARKELVMNVAKFYVHSKNPQAFGSMFLNQRVDVELYRLLKEKKIARVKYGWYRLI